MSDWWARKLGHTPQPPTQRPAPQRAPQVPQPVPQQQRPQQDPSGYTGTEHITAQNAAEALKWGKNNWTRQPVLRTEDGRSFCPECRSYNYFSRSKGRRIAPAPHCFDCGYNGLYEQGPEAHGIA